MKRKKMAEDEGTAELSCYMMKVIDDLMAGKKYPAVHTYISTLRSFIRFSGGRDVKLPMQEVFTPGRLKEYESWLMVQRKLSLNTVSTYMRTLQAVYNRWMPLGSGDYNPKLFDDVYTKVESHIKRALTELIGEDNIPFFFSIEVRLKLCLYPLATFPDVIDNNPQLFGYSFLEFKF